MRKNILFILSLLAVMSMAGCNDSGKQINQSIENLDTEKNSIDNTEITVTATKEIKKLEDGFFTVRYEGDYGFDDFLSGGGTSSDRQVIEFLTQNLLFGMAATVDEALEFKQ